MVVSSFIIIPMVGCVVFLYVWIFREKRKTKYNQISYAKDGFCVSAYMERMERETIKILNTKESNDKTITLWWGLDGLRLNEDGSIEWISRRKQKEVSQSAFYQPFGNIASQAYTAGADSLRAWQERLVSLQTENIALQIQAAQQAQIRV